MPLHWRPTFLRTVLPAVVLVGCLRQEPVRLVHSAEVPSEVRSVFVRLPQSNVIPGQALRVLVALHGIGGDGAALDMLHISVQPPSPPPPESPPPSSPKSPPPPKS